MQRKLKIQDYISKEATISATILIFNQQYKKRRGGEMFGFHNIRYCQNKTTRKDLNLKLVQMVQTTCPLVLPNKTCYEKSFMYASCMPNISRFKWKYNFKAHHQPKQQNCIKPGLLGHDWCLAKNSWLSSSHSTTTTTRSSSTPSTSHGTCSSISLGTLRLHFNSDSKH